MRTNKDRLECLSIKDAVYERYDGKCGNCGSTKCLEMHHVVPLLLGGKNEIGNMILLCHRCHKVAHNGGKISDYMDHSNAGPKNHLCDEEANKALGMYFSGQIGTNKLKEMFRWSKSYKITDSPQFKKYIQDNHVASYRNNVDIIEKKTELHSGRVVGYVVYADGRRVNMIYQ